MDNIFKPIQEWIQSKFIAANIGEGEHICSEEEQKLLSPPCWHGGLGIFILKGIAPKDFKFRSRLQNDQQTKYLEENKKRQQSHGQ